MTDTPATCDDIDPAACARGWIVRLASGSMRADELERFQTWLAGDTRHRAAFQRERQGWQDLAMIEDAFACSDDAVPARPARRLRAGRIGLAIAAAIVGVMALPSALVRLQADHRSPGNAIARVTLADGSLAVLDSGSAIAVDFDKSGRTVRLLEGRVWFEVRHGDARPFTVLARDGAIHDIGTAFEVDRARDTVRVSVTQGAVRVAGEDGAAIVAHAGEQVRYGDGQAAVRGPAAEPGTIAAWRNGEVLLRQVSLDTAIKNIARYRRSPVFVWGDLSHAPRVSGSFRADRADDALATLATMRDLEQVRLPGGILVLRPATAVAH